MKYILLFLSSFLSFASSSQVLNGSFENDSVPDLSFWKWTCGAESLNNAPSGGGSWCIKVWGGNPQSCFPGYAYQKIPAITNGQTFILSGWAFAQSVPVGIYFGKINNGLISLYADDTTSSKTWKHLSIQSSFTLSTGDTAVVVLHGGLVGGPAQCYGYFDLINLQQGLGISSEEQKQSIRISPNPFRAQTIIHTDILLNNATLTIDNCLGQRVNEIKNISGNSITLYRDNLPCGMYFLRLSEDNKTIATGKIVIYE
jgi:hypothetical protein